MKVRLQLFRVFQVSFLFHQTSEQLALPTTPGAEAEIINFKAGRIGEICARTNLDQCNCFKGMIGSSAMPMEGGAGWLACYKRKRGKIEGRRVERENCRLLRPITVYCSFRAALH